VNYGGITGLNDTNVPTAKHLSRRDLIILPLLSLSTIVFLLILSEVTARYFFPETGAKACEIDDATIGRRFRANCSARMKSAEGPWVTNHYNDCGYRTEQSCGPKAAGTIRIALLGSSNSEGLFVAADKTFAERTAEELKTVCKRPVEVQNMGRETCGPVCSFHRIDEALALKPDVVVLAISPFDIDDLNAEQVSRRYEPISLPSSVAQQRTGIYYKLKSFVVNSRAATIAQHLLFEDPDTYLRLYLPYASHSGYLTNPLSAPWEAHLQAFDTLLGEEAQKLHAANVPFVFVEIPNLAQASILSTHSPLAGIDAYAFNQRLAEISASHGIQFVNVLDAFKQTPNSNRLFYVVDGHLSGEGQVLISGPLVSRLTQGTIPALSSCGQHHQQ
jgi:hypothetical protein